MACMEGSRQLILGLVRRISGHPLALIGAVFLAQVFPSTPMGPPAQFVGEWRGTAKVVQVLTLDRVFPVRVSIHRDGTVTGAVGESTLRGGRFMRHRPVAISREERRDLMEYMIRAQLVGPVLTAERISAREVFIPLDYADGRFEAAVHTHGTVIAGREVGIFSSELTLRRSSR